MTEPSAAAAPPTDTASAAEDLVDIFVSPAKVFARRAKASPMFPYLVVCVVMLVLFFASRNILAPIFDAQIQKSLDLQMKTNPQFTPEMAEKAKPMIGITITIAGVIGVPVLLLISGLILWVVGRFFMSTDLTYGTALLITSFSWFPRILAAVVSLVEGLVMDVSRLTSPFQLSVSLARFFDPSKMTDGTFQLLGNVDLFAIWGTVICIIGLMHAAKMEKSKAIATGVILFVVSCLPAAYAVLSGK